MKHARGAVNPETARSTSVRMLLPRQRMQTIVSWAALAGLLLILCIRLTTNEPIEDGAFSGSAIATVTAGGYSNPGPREILTLAVGTLLLTCGALWAAGRVTMQRIGQLGLIVLLAGWATASAVQASNRFAAITGVFDMTMGLIAGWAVAQLCTTDRRRQFVISILAGLLAVICAKGFYQKYFELPETLRYFQQHKAAFFRQMGWGKGDPSILLFESRIKSQAVTGFLILSDALAEVILPLSLICLPLALFLFRRRPDTVPPASEKETTRGRTGGRISAGGEIPPEVVPGIPILLLFFASLAVLVFTLSKGGVAAEIICIITLATGYLNRQFLQNKRWLVAGLVMLMIAAASCAMVSWGLLRHGLPTKDLLYRWQYWTGAVRMTEHRPLLGVGLNNFGYYYTHYKLPNAPEDVKDPHNPIVRLASEAGLPAAAMWIALVLWTFLSAIRKPVVNTRQPAAKTGLIPPAWLGGFAGIWWIMQVMITAPESKSAGEWNFLFMQGICFAAVAFLGMVLANDAWRHLNVPQRRVVMLSLALGAAGMCLYDQINLALVTGPVAMLFWVCLGAAQPQTADSIAPVDSTQAADGDRIVPGRGQKAAAALLTMGAAVGIFAVWLPAETGRLAIDPAIWQKAYAVAAADHNPQAAMRAVDHVLQCKPRSEVWLGRKIGLLMASGKNPRRYVLRLLLINITNPRVRIGFAMTSRAGLTVSERIAQLKLALQLNSDLPRHELTRLTPVEIAQINHEIKVLSRRHGIGK